MDTLKLLTPNDNSLSWDLYSPWFRATTPSEPDGPPAISVSLLDDQAAKYITSVYSKGATFEYDAEQGKYKDTHLDIMANSDKQRPVLGMNFFYQLTILYTNGLCFLWYY
jgi:hypothetical protein